MWMDSAGSMPLKPKEKTVLRNVESRLGVGFMRTASQMAENVKRVEVKPECGTEIVLSANVRKKTFSVMTVATPVG